MDYQKIMCEFCKKCTEYKLNKRVIKSGSFVSGNITITKCENFIPKLDFKSSTEKCCSFLLDEQGEDYEVF